MVPAAVARMFACLLLALALLAVTSISVEILCTWSVSVYFLIAYKKTLVQRWFFGWGPPRLSSAQHRLWDFSELIQLQSLQLNWNSSCGETLGLVLNTSGNRASMRTFGSFLQSLIIHTVTSRVSFFLCDSGAFPLVTPGN